MKSNNPGKIPIFFPILFLEYKDFFFITYSVISSVTYMSNRDSLDVCKSLNRYEANYVCLLRTTVAGYPQTGYNHLSTQVKETMKMCPRRRMNPC